MKALPEYIAAATSADGPFLQENPHVDSLFSVQM